jgi:hypothetical protein
MTLMRVHGIAVEPTEAHEPTHQAAAHGSPHAGAGRGLESSGGVKDDTPRRRGFATSMEARCYA